MAAAQEGTKTLRFISFIQVFSLDVVLATLSIAAMVNHITNTIVPLVYWFVLPMAVWTIYTVDHLVDALSGGRKRTTLRHSIHLRYRKLMIILVAANFLVSMILAIIWLEPRLVSAGIWLGVIAGIYFLVLFFRNDIRLRFFFKEPIIALIFTTGVWLAPLMHYQMISPGAWTLLPVLYLTVLANLILNSIFEAGEDRHSGFSSVSTKIGTQWASIAFYVSIILSMVIVLVLSLYPLENRVMASALVLILIQVGFILIFKYPEWTSLNHRYRFIGDMLFVLCTLTLLS